MLPCNGEAPCQVILLGKLLEVTTILFVLFVCLFVGINPEKLYSASCVGREVKPLGVITHGQKHKPRAYQRHLNSYGILKVI